MVKRENPASKLLSKNLGILLLLSCGVIVFMNSTFNLVFVVSYLILFAANIKKRKLQYSNIGLYLTSIFITIALTLFFFIRPYDRPSFMIVWFIVFLSLFFLDDQTLSKAFKLFANIVCIICILALVNYALLILGVPLPNHAFTTSFRNTIYLMYPGTVFLVSSEYSVFGHTVYRLSGLFSEPGVFGLICCSILYSKVLNKSKIKQAVLIISALLSLSMGTYILLLGYLFFLLKGKQRVIATVTSILLLLAAYKIMPKEVLQSFFLDKLSENIIDARTSLSFTDFYNLYIKNSSIYRLFIGAGADVLSENDITSSDFRAFFIKFGAISVLLYWIWFFLCFKNTARSVWIPALFFFCVVFFHRSWMLYVLYFMFFIYYLSKSKE